MPRLEQRACGDLAMFWRARGRSEEAERWANYALGGPRTYELPPDKGHGEDGSHNFAPCLLAGAGLWDKLNELLAEYWRRGGGNEFNSPLYGARVYVAAALSACLAGGEQANRFLHRWTAFMALQAVVVANQPRRERFRWAGRDAPLSHQTKNGIALPPTGLRANGNSLGNPYFGPVLAHVLGLATAYHHVPKHYANWRPPPAKSDWGKAAPGEGRYYGNAPNPWTLVDTLRLLEEQTGRRLSEQPWHRHCRKAVEGNMRVWREIADALLKDDLPLPRGMKRFVVERSPDSVMTYWEGTGRGVQKPAVPAAAVLNGRTNRILMPAEWRVPSDRTTSRIDGGRIVATAAGFSDSLPRLEFPADVLELMAA